MSFELQARKEINNTKKKKTIPAIMRHNIYLCD